MTEDPQELLLAGLAAAKSKDYDEAIRLLSQANSLSPNNPNILTPLGFAYYRKGNSFQAEQYLGQSLLQDSNQPKAQEIFNLIKTKDPACSTQELLLAGLAAAKTANYDEAVDLLFRANMYDPHNPNILTPLGFAHYENGSLSKAQEYLIKSLEYEPDQPTIKELIKKIKVDIKAKKEDFEKEKAKLASVNNKKEDSKAIKWLKVCGCWIMLLPVSGSAYNVTQDAGFALGFHAFLFVLINPGGIFPSLEDILGISKKKEEPLDEGYIKWRGRK